MTQMTLQFVPRVSRAERARARRLSAAAAQRCGLESVQAECVAVLRRWDWRTSHEVRSLAGMRPIDPCKPDGYWDHLPHARVLAALRALVDRGFVCVEVERFDIRRYGVTRLGRRYGRRFDLRVLREGRAVA